jgi:hypothetical protein
MSRNPVLLRDARGEAIEIEPGDFLDPFEIVWVMCTGSVPDYLHDELACDRVQLYRDGRGRWILAPLDD